MRHIRRATIAGLAMIVASVAQARVPRNCELASKLEKRGANSLGCKMQGDICFVRGSEGGFLEEYMKDAEKYKIIVIDGRCVSACVLVADHFRDKVWITVRATFHVHQGEETHDREINGRMYVCFTGKRSSNTFNNVDLQAWITAHGGQPRNGFLHIHNKEARKFWRLYDPAKK